MAELSHITETSHVTEISPIPPELPLRRFMTSLDILFEPHCPEFPVVEHIIVTEFPDVLELLEQAHQRAEIIRPASPLDVRDPRSQMYRHTLRQCTVITSALVRAYELGAYFLNTCMRPPLWPEQNPKDWMTYFEGLQFVPEEMNGTGALCQETLVLLGQQRMGVMRDRVLEYLREGTL